ncbi:hypothetical protein O5O45_26275 [Hahella aquimaris]|uniref:hypothetical protein n=1 Tax=Hahella sp. HNIBRBA332 TaxID=3015983 RepID=UPI00273CAEFC|nr:hypothetical protein [Hahella sp. HNIBRBA332]WLQ13241.1 hypothetical protein O5O45_26275 [Hahella sp. HNIBRBA332]
MKFRSFVGSVALEIFVIIGLAACGGGGGDSGGATATVSANGLWEGTFTENGSGTFDVSGLFYNGRIIAISESAGAIYDGSYTVSGSSISGNVTAYQVNGGAFATASISGTVSVQGAISVTFNTSYGSSGSMSLSFNSIYNRTPSLSLLAGQWNYTSGAYSLTITVQNDGTYWGQDSDGCVVSGTIGLLDTAHNLYNASTSIASCGASNGSYTGFSSLLDNVTTNDTLQVAVSNSNFILLYPFTRQ